MLEELWRRRQARSKNIIPLIPEHRNSQMHRWYFTKNCYSFSDVSIDWLYLTIGIDQLASISLTSFYYFEGDVATGQFATSSVGEKRSSVSDAAIDCDDESVTILDRAQDAVPVNAIVQPAKTQPPAAAAAAAAAAVKSETSSVSQPPVRPFVKKLKTKSESVVPELIRQIIASQEGFRNRMSPYDKAIKIFEERFQFGLTDLITLFADSPSAVQQFLSFNEHQRDIFVQRNKSKLM